MGLAGSPPRRRSARPRKRWRPCARSCSGRRSSWSSPTTPWACGSSPPSTSRKRPPHLPEAQLAIDALSALVEGLTGRLGEPERSLRDGLAEIRMAFVQIHNAERPAWPVGATGGRPPDRSQGARSPVPAPSASPRCQSQVPVSGTGGKQRDEHLVGREASMTADQPGVAAVSGVQVGVVAQGDQGDIAQAAQELRL